MTLTRAQRNNLNKLATYLEGLPRRYRHFDMNDYFSIGGVVEREYALKNGGVATCGAVACAVGHGPAAGILFRRSDFNDYDWPDWNAYAARFVGPWQSREYEWAFSGAWWREDGHHWGAAARIRYLLKHGGPPPEFDEPDSVWRKHYREFDKRSKAKAAA